MLRAWNRFSLIKWNCLKFTILYQTSKKMFKKKFNFAVNLSIFDILCRLEQHYTWCLPNGIESIKHDSALCST